MASPAEIHDGGKDSADDLLDVFHTPPEESSLPSSVEHQPPVTPSDVDLSDVSQTVNVDVGTQGSVILCGRSDGDEFADLGNYSDSGLDSDMVAEVERDDASGEDSELSGDETRVSKDESSDIGFSSSLSVDAEIVSEFEGNVVPDQDFECHVDGIRVSKRESSDSVESPARKMKLPEHDIGFGSSVEFLGAESQKTEEGVENCKGKLISDADTETPCSFGETLEPQNLGSDKNLETPEVAQTEDKENARSVNLTAGKFLRSCDEVVEASGTMEKNDSELKADIAKNFVSEKEAVKIEDSFCYKVVKYIIENYGEEYNLESINWSDVVQNCGATITFPCPRWWPEDYEEEFFKSTGLKLERD